METRHGRAARILVVEDEPGIALGLEDSLRLEGYEVELFTNGAAASRRALEQRFDLILLDVMLPGKDGFEVCGDLRRAGQRVPIIFLTARIQEADRVAGLTLGANDFVTKPFSSRELMARVRGLLQFVETNRQDRRRLEDEVDAAAQVQQRLFPSALPPVCGLDYAGICQPARGVSGDFYDFVRLPSGRLAMLLADVSGKGMAAALLASSVHAAVRSYASTAEQRCGEVVAQVNRLLFETTSAERFVTLFYAVFDPADRTLTWTNAGHCPPVCIRGSGVADRLEPLTPPAGIFPELASEQRAITLAPGDRLLVVSDGITEAKNSVDEDFGDTRLPSIARRHRTLSASQLCSRILEDVRLFTEGVPEADDRTVLAIQLHGSPS